MRISDLSSDVCSSDLFERIGVPSRRVAIDAEADLTLIDEVTPNDDPLWGLRRLSCRTDTLCNGEAQRRIDEATAATSPTDRARLIGEAEAILGRYAPFIPLATPLRWSVASQRLSEIGRAHV